MSKIRRQKMIIQSYLKLLLYNVYTILKSEKEKPRFPRVQGRTSILNHLDTLQVNPVSLIPLLEFLLSNRRELSDSIHLLLAT